MLKLTAALIQKAAEISQKVSDELRLSDVNPSGDPRVRPRTLSDRVVRGLLSLITSEITDETSVDMEVLPTQSEHFKLEPVLTRSDLLSIYPHVAELDADRREALASLRTLSLTQATQIFMSIELLVMRSGKGHTFGRWREAWRGATLGGGAAGVVPRRIATQRDVVSHGRVGGRWVVGRRRRASQGDGSLDLDKI